MSNSSDAYVQFPISGTSQSAPTAVRIAQQVSIASTTIICSPAGGMTGSYLAVAANPNRSRLVVLNSGSQALGMSARYFAPNLPMTPSNYYNQIIPGTNVVQQGNQQSPQGESFESPQPIFTGEIHIAWIGATTLSGSVAVITEGSYG